MDKNYGCIYWWFCPNTFEVLNIEALTLCEMAEIPTDLREIFEKLLFILFFPCGGL